MKIFCIPHAGGLITSYTPLKKSLMGIAEVVGIELAGRGEKEKFSLYHTFAEAVCDVASDITESLSHSSDEPYMLLGHSMGSWLAYEVCYQLRKWEMRGPKHLIFSGNNAPPACVKGKGSDYLSDEEFIENILELGHKNSIVFSNPLLRKMFLPILRSDLRITEGYTADLSRPCLDCDITVIFGNKDPLITEEVRGWERITNGTCQLHNYEGGHFFIYEKTEEIALEIKKIIGKIS